MDLSSCISALERIFHRPIIGITLTGTVGTDDNIKIDVTGKQAELEL
jgi:hypothetical protein